MIAHRYDAPSFYTFSWVGVVVKLVRRQYFDNTFCWGLFFFQMNTQAHRRWTFLLQEETHRHHNTRRPPGQPSG